MSQTGLSAQRLDGKLSQTSPKLLRKRYAWKGILWEIWNEPNLKHFWSPQPSVEDYCRFVEKTAERIRKADPSGLIVAGATSQIPLGWLEDCFKKGMLKWIDVLSVHPYRSKPLRRLSRNTLHFANSSNITPLRGKKYFLYPANGDKGPGVAG